MNKSEVERFIEPSSQLLEPYYSVEFFHIYTDEAITPAHNASMHYLKEVRQAWQFNYQPILLIDDYNPTEHKLSATDVLAHLKAHDALPAFWAFESAMVDNAELLLKAITKPKLQRNYQSYIQRHGKYPCSLLTAAWYLTRLGKLPHQDLIHSTGEAIHTPAARLINILHHDYKPVEMRAREIIANSQYKEHLDSIQNLFIPGGSGRELSLW